MCLASREAIFICWTYKKECDSTTKAGLLAGFEYTSNLSCFHVNPDSIHDPGSPSEYCGFRNTLKACEFTILSPSFVFIVLIKGFVSVKSVQTFPVTLCR